MPKKIYCYVDETGQHTGGEYFLVAIVIVQENRDEAERLLEEIERVSGKGKRKWTNTRPQQKTEYMRLVLNDEKCRGTLTYTIFYRETNYPRLMIEATARAISKCLSLEDYKVTILVDALSKSQEKTFKSGLHQWHLPVDKVRGIRDENSSALLRLADALCGFTRVALQEGNAEYQRMLEAASRKGYIVSC